MIGWHHRLDGHEFEQAPGVGDGQGSLACCSPQGHKESDTTELNTCIMVSQMVTLGIKGLSQLFVIISNNDEYSYTLYS